jgi:hypothetical protein
MIRRTLSTISAAGVFALAAAAPAVACNQPSSSQPSGTVSPQSQQSPPRGEARGFFRHHHRQHVRKFEQPAPSSTQQSTEPQQQSQQQQDQQDQQQQAQQQGSNCHHGGSQD